MGIEWEKETRANQTKLTRWQSDRRRAVEEQVERTGKLVWSTNEDG